MPIDKTHIAILIPSYNEGERIAAVVQKIINHGYKKIVIVDDGSTDNSMELIKNYRVIILRHLVNRGAGAATETGLKYCREVLHSEHVVMIDADTQHDADDIDMLVDTHLKNNADISIGNRFIRPNPEIPFSTRYFNFIANFVTSVFAGKKITDSQSGFKVFNKRALDTIMIEHDKFEHCSEILIKGHKFHLKIIDVPIRVYYPDEIQQKGQNLKNGIVTFINLLYSTLFKSH